MKEINRLNKLIVKLIRKDERGFINPVDLTDTKKYSKVKVRLIDEVTDFILVMDQISEDFMSQIIDRFNFKYFRLVSLTQQDPSFNL